MASTPSAPLSAPPQQVAERVFTADEPRTSVEMHNLQPQQRSSTEQQTAISSFSPPTTSATLEAPSEPQTAAPSTAPQPSQSTPAAPSTDSAPATATAQTTSRPHTARAETEAIGPSSDIPTPSADPAGGPAVVITLLVTTGTKHPYKVDAKYLRKRGVEVEDMNPFNISVYQLKELILRDWREEWEPKPSSPNAIRLIHFGRYLEDNQYLKDCRFNPNSPNVVHMTVKPAEIADDEDGAGAKAAKGSRARSDRGDDERTAGCRCVIL